MAMKVGGEYGVVATSGRHWRRFATTNHLDPDELTERIDRLAELLPPAFESAARADEVADLGSPLPARLVERVTTRAAGCRRGLRQ
jgi:hypothetical protein